MWPKQSLQYNNYTFINKVHIYWIVYTATTQVDFVRIVAKVILPHFIANKTILMF